LDPRDNAVVRLGVGGVRQIPGLTVEHSPEPTNRAHSHVLGKKNAKAKVKLRRLSTLVLALPDDPC